ncbi:MAG: DUF211 domain-containing protein [Candidatus Methanofastidiosia archaeon]
MNGLKVLVLDVLKPHDPTLPEFAKKICSLSSVDGVNISLLEIDHETENIKITLQGEAIDFEEVEVMISEIGGSIHSIDKVAAGVKVVSEANTPQDRI